jgi:serine phosphatase RsbU (regulator of sigma subunit)
VTEGRVVITCKVEGGDDDFVIGFLGPGGYFGEMALISDEPRAATVTTIVETQVLEITKEQFDEVFSASPAMARSILKTLIESLRETDRRAIEDLEARNVELAEAYAELEAAQADRVARAALEAQLEVAGKAQRSLLPTRLPTVSGFQFAAQFEPARQVGGDFYDVRLLADGRATVLLADVSDKGAHAALFMAVTRALFLAEEHYLDDPVQIALAVHEGLLSASSYDMFVTALYGILDPQTGLFRYVRAGHDEPLFVRQDGTAEFLGGKGRFLGLWADMPPKLEEQQLQFDSGDCLVIYSDGVTDMRNPEGQSFGRGQVMNLVRSIRVYDANRIARSIYNVVQQHRGNAEAFDDFTLLVLRAE